MNPSERPWATSRQRSHALLLTNWKLRGEKRQEVRRWIGNPYRTTEQIERQIEWMESLPDREDGYATARVTPAIIDAIREEYEAGAKTQDLAMKYGVSRGYVYAIGTGTRSRKEGYSSRAETFGRAR